MIQVIAGGQYGSEAKGHVAAILARETPNLMMAVRVGGPNAGHTVYDEETGRPIALRQIPVASVAKPGVVVAIGAGSEIDPEVLSKEMDLISIGWGPLNLMIDPQATMMQSLDATQEKAQVDRIGSTGKGIGVARARRLARIADLAGEHYGVSENVADRALRYLANGGVVQLEGSQGYGLGLHAGQYPYCTSDDCRIVDILARAGMSPFENIEAWLVFRTFPIRVAGNSGPLHQELSWEEAFPHVEPERTTVTQKIRRIGQWDPRLFNESLDGNGANSEALEQGSVRIALTFADYIDPQVSGVTDWEQLRDSETLMEWIWHNIEAPCGVPPALICTGPRTHVWWGGMAGGHPAFSGSSWKQRGWLFYNCAPVSARDFFDDGRR